MKLLQLVESAYNILFVCKFLCSLTQMGLCFQVLFEVQFTCLAVQLQQVIELLHIELIVAPQFVGTLSRNVLYLTPLLLQSLELLICLTCLLR